MTDVQRVWINSSELNASFIDYTYEHRGTRCVTRMLVPPGVGVRLPKSTVDIGRVGPDMREGRAE